MLVSSALVCACAFACVCLYVRFFGACLMCIFITPLKRLREHKSEAVERRDNFIQDEAILTCA